MRRTLLRVAAVVGSLAAGGAALVASIDGQVDAGKTAMASDGEVAEPAKPTTVELTTVQVGELSTYITATANLLAKTQIEVVAESSGRVTAVHAEQGETVSGGDLLVSLDAKSAKMAVATAQIKAENANALAGRAGKLADKDLVAAEELEKLTTDRDVARRALADAKFSLSRRRVRAPRAGKVTRRDVTAGQYVREGDALFELTDFGTLEARIHIPERDALAVTAGRPVELVLQAQPDVKFTGVIGYVSDKVDPQSGTVELVLHVEGAPAQVRSGSFVGVKLIRTRNDTANWLPREAVLRGPRGAHVFVVDAGVAHQREVVAGAEERGRLEIVEGLAAEEQVVLSGHGGLKDGDPVEPSEPK